MLKTDITDKLPPISLGIGEPTIKDQIEAMGMTLPNYKLWEKRHNALNLLRVGGYLTDTETLRIGKRLVQGLCQDVHFHAAIADLAQEIAQVAITPTEAGGSEPQPAAGGELGAYLGDAGASE